MFVQPDRPVCIGNRLLQRGSNRRLVGELLLNRLDGPAQNTLVNELEGEVGRVDAPDRFIESRQGSAGSILVDAALAEAFFGAITQILHDRPSHQLGVDLAEHRLLKLGYGLQLIGPLLGHSAMLGLAETETDRDDRRHHQRPSHDCTCNHTRAIAPHELAQPVRGAGRPCQDRLVVQVPPQVHGQAVGRLVPAIAVLLQGLHHDPVQVAAQLAQKGPRIGPASIRARRRFIAETAQPCAGPGRLLLADDPLDLAKARLAQRCGIKRQRPGQ